MYIYIESKLIIESLIILMHEVYTK